MPFNPATGFTVGFGNQNPRQRTIADESTKFPGITKSDEAKIMNIARNQAHSSYEEDLIANDLYKEALKNQNSKNYVNNRQEAKQELYKQSINTKDTKQSNRLRTTERTAEVADMIRNYAKSNGYGNTLEGWGDVDVINGFTNDNRQAKQEIEDYINGDESSFNFSKRMGFGAGKNRSRFDMISEDKGEWNDDILGHFETESYEEADNKVGTRFKNLGKSAYNLASDLTNMVANPLDTVNNLGKAAVGGVSNLLDVDDEVSQWGDRFESANQVADGMGDFLKDRYGGVDQIANSLYQDPVGVISDIASIATGGAGLVKGAASATAKTAAKVGAKSVAKNASKVADVAGDVMKAGIKYDPATQILNAEGKVLKGAYKGAKATVNTVTHPIESIKGAYRSVAEGLNNISDRGAEKITKTATAQDKLYKAQEPRMNILTKNKDLQKRRLNSDRANQLIVENGYKPTDTNSRLLAHEATMRKIWGEVERRINGGEAVQIDQSRLANVLYDYISEQKSLGSSFNKADLTALQKELKTLEGKNIDLPTLEKKKQLYNSIINNRGEQKVSDVFANGIKKLTHEIGVIEDSILAEIPGDFQKLKNDFGALKDTYEDVFKADMKNQRKKGMGLTETYSRIEGAGDMINGALSIFNGGAKDIIKGAGKVLIGKSLAKAKDVDFLVKQGFDELVNGYKKSGNDKISEYNYQNNLNPNNTNNDLYGGNRMSLGDSRTSNGGLQEGGAEMSSRSLEMNGNGGGAEMSASGKSNGGASTSGKPIRAEAQEMETITNDLKAKNPKGAFVDTHTPEEYASYKNFTNSDKSATISVKPDGDIVNFVTDGTPGKGKELMFSAIENGGNKMDNYGAGLVNYYEKFGFEPVAKVKFNREYAPSNWNYARDGEPYIYVMRHNGDDIATVRNNYGKYPHKTSEELNALKELEYDEALKYRDDLMNRKELKDINTSEDVYKYAQDNKESIFNQYREKNGGYVNPDDFRDYINDNKRLEAAITHEGASSLADEYFERLVAENPNGKGIVVAGGPGGGKGTSIKALGIDKQGADILVDKTKGNKELKKMLDAGMEVDYYVVVPDADKIVSNIIGRAARGGAGGRTLPINSMGIPTHKKVAEIVKDLYKEGKETGKFNVKFIDNAGKIEEINLKEGLDGYRLLEEYGAKLDQITPEVVEREAKKRLDEGKITPDQYKQLIASMGGILFIGSVLGGGEE